MGIEFEENTDFAATVTPPPTLATESGIIGILITQGIAKDRTQALFILSGVAIVCLVLIALVLFGLPGSSEPPAPLMDESLPV